MRQITCYLNQSRKGKPQKPLLRKNRDYVPRNKCSGTVYGVLRLVYKQKDER